jgi:hypothetical protein
VENFFAQNIPYREIWPLKITGKIRFFSPNLSGGPEKRRENIHIAFTEFAVTFPAGNESYICVTRIVRGWLHGSSRVAATSGIPFRHNPRSEVKSP